MDSSELVLLTILQLVTLSSLNNMHINFLLTFTIDKHSNYLKICSAYFSCLFQTFFILPFLSSYIVLGLMNFAYSLLGFFAFSSHNKRKNLFFSPVLNYRSPEQYITVCL